MWTAYVGTRDYSVAGGETHGVTGIAIHPQYTGSVGRYDARFDVAVMFLDTPSRVLVGEVGTETDWGAIGVTLGWGHYNYDHENRLNDPRLKAVNLELGSDEICAEWLNYQSEVYVPSLHVCAWDDEGDDCVMHGDSGAPLVVNNKIIGITAYSPPPINGGWGPCGKDAMQVYTWVAGPLLRTWLLTVPNPTPPAPPPPPVKDCGAQAQALRAAQWKAGRLHRRLKRASRVSGRLERRLGAAKRLVRVKKRALVSCQTS
jgi:hypothetical protein